MCVYGACFVFMSVVVTGWGLWEVCCVESVVEDSVFRLGVLDFVCLCR